MGLNTMLCLFTSSSTLRRSFSCAVISSSSVISSVPDPMMMSSTNRSAQSRIGPSKSSIMRWKTALPFLVPMGTTFHCLGPSGVDIPVQGLGSRYSGICR